MVCFWKRPQHMLLKNSTSHSNCYLCAGRVFIAPLVFKPNLCCTCIYLMPLHTCAHTLEVLCTRACAHNSTTVVCPVGAPISLTVMFGERPYQ